MPNVAIYNISGAKVGEMELSENIFGQELNVPAMHAHVKAISQISVRALRALRPARKFPAAAKSPGGRRAPVVPVRVQPDPPSGRTAALYSLPSPATIA